MYPEDEKQMRDSAVEHIEEAAIADGLDSGAKAQPEQSKDPSAWTASEENFVEAAEEHIEEASIADGKTK